MHTTNHPIGSFFLGSTSEFNGMRTDVQNEFGTTDLGMIYRKTGGLITPTQAKLLERVVRDVPPSRTWTREQQSTLLDVVTNVMSDSSVTGRAREEGERVLREYPLQPLRR